MPHVILSAAVAHERLPQERQICDWEINEPSRTVPVVSYRRERCVRCEPLRDYPKWCHSPRSLSANPAMRAPVFNATPSVVSKPSFFSVVPCCPALMICNSSRRIFVSATPSFRRTRSMLSQYCWHAHLAPNQIIKQFLALNDAHRLLKSVIGKPPEWDLCQIVRLSRKRHYHLAWIDRLDAPQDS